MDNEANQNQQGVAASQTMDAGVAAAQGDPNVEVPKVEAPAAQVQAQPAKEEPEEVQAPSLEEKLAAQNEANLRQAIENGYKPEAEPSKEERARTLVADMEHTVANNGPITIAMLREVRDLLGVDVR